MMKQVKSRNLQRFLAFFLSLVLLMGALPVFAADGDWQAAKQEVLKDKAWDALREAAAENDFLQAVSIGNYTMPEDFDASTDVDNVATASVTFTATKDGEEEPATATVDFPIGTYTFGFESITLEDATWNVSDVQINGEESAALTLEEGNPATVSYKLTKQVQGEADSLDPFVTKITLTHKGNTIDLGDSDSPALENVKNGDEVQVAYEFAIENPTQEGFKAGVSYPVTIPQKNFTYDMANEDVNIEKDGEQLATFRLNREAKTASFTFTDALTDLDTNVTGSFSYSGKIAISNEGDEDELIFSIGGKEVKVPISTGSDDDAVAGKTKKTGKFLPGTGEILWTITVTPPADGIIPEKLTLTDKMSWASYGNESNKNIHELVAIKSVTVNGKGTGDSGSFEDLKAGEGYTLTPDLDKHGFKLVINEEHTDVASLVITYTSKLSEDGIKELNGQTSGKQGEKTVHNKVVTHNASVNAGDAAYSWGTARANVKFDFSLLQKTLVGQENGVATWRLFVNKSFATMPKGVQIIDTPKDMTYKADSLKVYIYNTESGTDPSNANSYSVVTDDNVENYITTSTDKDGKVTFQLVKELKVPMIIELQTELPGTFNDQTEFTNTAQLIWEQFGVTVSASTGKLNSSTIRKGGLGFHLPLRAAGWNVYLGQTSGESTIVDTIGANQKLIAADDTLKAKYADDAKFTPAGGKETTLKAFYESIFNEKVTHNMNNVTNGLTTIYLQRIKTGNVADVTWKSAPAGNAIALPLSKAVKVEGETTATASYENGKLTVAFDGPLEGTYRMRYWTAVDDKAIYGASALDKLPQPENSITLSIGGKTYTASTGAANSNTKEQFTKSAGAEYDKSTGKVGWVIEANQWSLPYDTGFTVVDTLPEGHRLPTLADTTLDKSKITVEATGTFATGVTYVHGEDYLLEKTSPDGKDVLTVRFLKPIYTGVRVSFSSTITDADLQKQVEDAVKNWDSGVKGSKASLIWTNYGQQQGNALTGDATYKHDDTATQELSFMPIQKSGSLQDDQKDLIKWTITLNKGFMPIENTNGKTITDTLTVEGLPAGVAASAVVSEPQDVTLKVHPAQDQGTNEYPLQMEPSDTESWYEYNPETLTMTVHLVTPYDKGEYDHSMYYLSYNTRINVPEGLEKTEQISVKNGASWYGKSATAAIGSIKISEVLAAVDWETKGRLTVTKFASTGGKDIDGNPIPDIEQPLQGAYIEVHTAVGTEGNETAGERVKGGYTQKDGAAKFILMPGKYIVKEVAAPRGYVASEQSKKGILVEVVAGDTTTANNYLHIGNEKITGGITVKKYEALDNASNGTLTANTQKPLAGVEFGLFKKGEAEGTEPMERQFTDETGTVNFGNLPVGDYEVRELKALPGYHPDQEGQSVSVEQKDKFYDLIFINEPILGSLHVEKVSEVGNYALAGATFDLLAADQKTVVTSDTTDANGELVFDDLRLGTYYLRETKAPNGYVANNALIKVEITENMYDNITNKVVTNRAETPENPENPDNPTPPTPDTPIPPTDVPTGGGTRRVIVDTSNLTPEQVEQLIEDGFVPLSDLPDLTPEEIIDNQIPLAYIPPTEVPLASAEPIEDGTPHTGDNTPLALMLMLMAASAAGLVVLRKRRV